MSTWCNARLRVSGFPADVSSFRRLARRRPGLVFRDDMLVGECQELFSERAEAFGVDLLQKTYVFQGRSDEGLEHFQDLSRTRPRLRFVLVYGWDDHTYGSYLIINGRVRSYCVPDRLVEKVMARHGVTDDFDDEWPIDGELDAEAELMDLAGSHWDKSLLRLR